MISFVINALASFVGTMLMMVTIVHRKFLLSKLCQVFHNNILVVKTVGVLMRLFNSIHPYIQNEPSDHELFISKLIQQKLQNEYAQPFSAIAITLDLPTVESEDSLRMGDEHFDTIPATKSDEFIKSSVENLVPNLSESEDLSDSECDFAGELILLKTIPSGIDETDCDPEEEIHLIEKLLHDNSSPRPPKEFISENSDAAIESFCNTPTRKGRSITNIV
nr:hypothetical protein [Tanacetum cinerariifolium]